MEVFYVEIAILSDKILGGFGGFVDADGEIAGSLGGLEGESGVFYDDTIGRGDAKSLGGKVVDGRVDLADTYHLTVDQKIKIRENSITVKSRFSDLGGGSSRDTHMSTLSL